MTTPETYEFSLTIGDDYTEELDRHTDFDIDFDDPAPELWSVKVGAYHDHHQNFLGTGSLVSNGSDYAIRVEWPKENIPACPATGYLWQAKLVSPAGLVRTKVEGPLELTRDAVPGE